MYLGLAGIRVKVGMDELFVEGNVRRCSSWKGLAGGEGSDFVGANCGVDG